MRGLRRSAIAMMAAAGTTRRHIDHAFCGASTRRTVAGAGAAAKESPAAAKNSTTVVGRRLDPSSTARMALRRAAGTSPCAALRSACGDALPV